MTPFHAGELEAQARAGGGSRGLGIRSSMTDQQRAFFAALPWVVAGTTDAAGAPLATLLAGRPGFIWSPDPSTLRIRAAGEPGALVAGAPIGLLGIELDTRRRNRANGVIASAGGGELVVDVRQAFGNCPQYITPRRASAAAPAAAAPERLAALDGEARALIAGADLFFIASAAPAGVDVSHRGGPPGFVRREGDVLLVPDYAGNRYFMTLGNLVADPRAALLFLDLERGDLLHVQGSVEIVWEGRELDAFPDAQRLIKVRVGAAWRRRGGGLVLRR